MSHTSLPLDLHDAFAWVNAAGEIEEFCNMSSADADQYAADAEENFSQCWDDPSWANADVTIDSLLELRDFLLTDRAGDN